ncbi:MAG TPA: HAD-IC family P-type ATPase [Propionibacteriaceae bacterium]
MATPTPELAPASVDAVGLTSSEAEARRRRGEHNLSAVGSSRGYLRIVRTNVLNLYNGILFGIGGALLALGRYSDAFISAGIGVLNALISTVQEIRAKRQLDRLQLAERGTVVVVRDGRDVEVGPEDVVRGDVVRVRIGDPVVVDGPVLEGAVEVADSVLTADTDAQLRGPGDELLSGTRCVGGGGLQLARDVGAASYVHRLTVEAQRTSGGTTALQRRIAFCVRLVMVLVILMTGAILLEAALEGMSLERVVQITAVLSGLVPYGLFLLIVLAYTAGAVTASRRGALVQRVNAVESMSSVDVICCDHVGTLTTGRLTVTHVEVLGGHDVDEVATALGSMGRSTSATDRVNSALARHFPGEAVPGGEDMRFGSSSERSAVRTGDVTWVLGTPEALAGQLGGHGPTTGSITLSAASATALSAAPATSLSAAPATALGAAPATRVTHPATPRAAPFTNPGPGRRVLVFARAVEPAGTPAARASAAALPALEPLAVVTLADELRSEAADTIARMSEAGVALKILSRDDPGTVAALAARLGLPDSTPVDARDLRRLPDAELDARVARDAVVLGNVDPEQKERIVASLGRQGRHVALVGDGVHDLRALQAAHVAVAMRSGSAVAREVADIVLTDDSLAALLPTRTEGRRIISGIAVSAQLFLTRVATQALIIVTITMLGLGFPYSPAQTGLTLFTVGLPTIFLTAWARPSAPDERLLLNLARFILPAAVITSGCAVVIYTFLYTTISRGFDDPDIRDRLIAEFQNYTDLTYGVDASFVNDAAALGAQTGLSTFVSLASIVLILFLAPPHRLFAAWTRPVADRRPAILVVALLVGLLTALVVPVFRDYFGLTRPAAIVYQTALPMLLIWFLAVTAAFRFKVMDRLLGLPDLTNH